MAQVTDRTIGANPTGFDMRTELNNIIAALESDNSGSSEPLNTVPYMKWMDTSNATYYYVKERNHDNTAWVTLFRYTVATKVMEAVSNGIVLQDTAIEIHASTPKTTPIDADEIGIWDSISSTLQKLTWANLKATLKTYFDTLYVALSGNQTIDGIKTFTSFQITPSSAPTTDYQVANKKYVDDSIVGISGALSTSKLMHAQDQKTSGTAGGASSAGTNTRVLNTVVSNTITGSSLASNQITLPAGTYWVEASCPCSNAGQSKAYLYNATDANVQIVSTSEYIGNTLSAQHRVFLSGKFTISAQKTFDIRHYITNAQPNNGLGVATTTGQVEIYTDIKIWKVA